MLEKIPNIITGTSLKLVQPWEVEMCIESLLEEWDSSQKKFKNVLKFHVNFEKIHSY